MHPDSESRSDPVSVTLPGGRIGPAQREHLQAALASGADVLVQSRWAPVEPPLIGRLVEAASAPLAASVSVLPVHAGPLAPTVIPSHPLLLTVPTLPRADARLVLLPRRVLDLVPLPLGTSDEWPAVLEEWSQRAHALGFRHVAAPGTAVVTDSGPAGESPSQPGNTLLEAHQLWATTKTGRLRLVIDGACLPEEPGTGTHHVILELAAALKRQRPSADVLLAVPRRAVPALRRRLQRHGVEVVAHDRSFGRAHVAYRPYQMLEPADLVWLRSTADRWMFSQLDMIGFSNEAYHPDAQMFHMSRNLQRAMLRHADAVTFISDFGRSTALAECPELDERRCVAIPIGTGNASSEAAPDARPVIDGPFVFCLAAEFFHKNRTFALQVFAEMRRQGYAGGIVLAGPVLVYGSSAQAERDLVQSWAPAERDTVHWLGAVDEDTKWWLLRNADAVLYPSVVEGFGLIPFEAASAGTPTLAATGSAFEELAAGSEVELAHAWQPAAWADTLLRWCRDPAERAAQIDAISGVAQRYTWDRCAERTWALIDDVVALPSRSAPWTGREDGRGADRIEHLELGLSRRGRSDRITRRYLRGLARRLGKLRQQASQSPNHDPGRESEF